MRALVTGGAGFVGSHLVDLLVSKGDDVIVIDDLSTGRIENLKQSIDKIRFERMDLNEFCDTIFFNVDVVFHLAAFVSVPRSIETPINAHHRGSALTFRMLEASRQAGAKRFIHASSCAVYAPRADNMPRMESESTAPATPYAANKAAGESMTHAYSSCYPMDGVSLRFFNIYGPRQASISSYSGVVARFCEAAVKGKELEIHGDGLQSRDFIYVGDIAKACYAAATTGGRLNGISLNIGTGEAKSVLDIADAVDDCCREKHPRRQVPCRAGDARAIVANTNKMYLLTKFKPEMEFSEGIAKTMDWYASQE